MTRRQEHSTSINTTRLHFYFQVHPYLPEVVTKTVANDGLRAKSHVFCMATEAIDSCRLIPTLRPSVVFCFSPAYSQTSRSEETEKNAPTAQYCVFPIDEIK
jgi:hypothetical protein